MADVKLTCDKCGAEMTVSEFAKIENISCKCGSRMKYTEAFISAGYGKPRKTSLTVKSEEQIIADNAQPPEPEEWRFLKATEKTEEDLRQQKNIHLWLSWLWFIVLAGVSGYLRYKNGALSEANMATLKMYSPYIFGALYILIILKAFKDTVFQGLLCLIPFYPFYYTIMICDDFYFRATVLGLLPGIGQESLTTINKEVEIIIRSAQNWIATGG